MDESLQLNTIFNAPPLELYHRIRLLKKLKRALETSKPELFRVLDLDLGKSESEALLTEYLPSIMEINEAIANVDAWAQPKKVGTPVYLMGTQSQIQYRPKGTVLILSPWNYPLFLNIGPLVAALAAGNKVIVKPSEFSVHTSQYIKKICDNIFTPEECQVWLGDHTLADALTQENFDHIFFTGSPRVGKRVMANAAKNLTPVTLELGGKSPTVVFPSAELSQAAHKIAFGKWVNSGQTCIAPDYLLVHSSIKERFMALLVDKFKHIYGASQNNWEKANYAKMIHERHFDRLKKLTEEAIDCAKKVYLQGHFLTEDLKITPTLVEVEPSSSASFMEQEIFGPLLPILPFDSDEEAITIIQKNPNPLSMYIFGAIDDQNQRFIKQVPSGGACINDTILQIANSHLPFGGVGQSGMGAYHGHHGFLCFSHQQSVMERHLFAGAINLLYPPFNKIKTKQIDRIIRWSPKWPF